MPKTKTEVPDSAWFKSSYSGGNETECVETALIPGTVSVRDSKRLNGHLFQVNSATWTAFLEVVRNEQLG